MTNNRFRESIELYFDDVDIKSKKHLEILMRKRHFFNAKDEGKRARQSQTLLDDAWKHLKELEKEKPNIAKQYKPYKVEDIGRKRKLVRDNKTGRIIGWV